MNGLADFEAVRFRKVFTRREPSAAQSVVGYAWPNGALDGVRLISFKKGAPVATSQRQPAEQ